MSPRRLYSLKPQEAEKIELPKIKVTHQVKEEIVKVLRDQGNGYKYCTELLYDGLIEKLRRIKRNGKYKGKRDGNNGCG